MRRAYVEDKCNPQKDSERLKAQGTKHDEIILHVFYMAITDRHLWNSAMLIFSAMFSKAITGAYFEKKSWRNLVQ